MKRWILAAPLALAVFMSGCAVRADYYRRGTYPSGYVRYEYRRDEYRRGDDNGYRGGYGHNDGDRGHDGRYDNDGYRDERYPRGR